MCGIAGAFEYAHTTGRLSEPLLIRMRETLRHRGPDGSGVYLTPDHRLGFAHRRLAIVDLDGGAQPMFGSHGTCLIFNGEIYNYPTLRKRLEAEGVRFRTDCDTEVILHLYERWGFSCLEHLVGMFAFAIWDPQRKAVFMARDPIGEKPLYWGTFDGVLVFASEIKAMLEHPAVPREVNEDAIGPFLANLVTPRPQTLYRGINKLPAGHLAVCDSRGVRISPYRPKARPRSFTAHVSLEEAEREVRELLETSVRARLMSDVPVGVMLSGGFDSSAIVALLRAQASELSSFTVGYPGHDAFDEREEARFVAQRFGTDHHEILLTEDDTIGSFAKLVHHQDEPMADPIAVAVYAVCRRASEVGVKVILAGEGSDELFWGYAGYRGVIARFNRYRALLAMPALVRRAAAMATSPTRSSRRREQLDGLAEGRVRPIHMPLGLTRHQRRCLMLTGSTGEGWAPSQGTEGEDALTRLVFDTQEYEFQMRLPELLLMRIDRFSMAASVEARVPFLDPTLVDYAYRLPLDLRLHQGATKYVLKRALSDIVPARITNRPKQGFTPPTSEWFAKRHGALLTELMEHDALRRYFDIDYLRGLLAGLDPNNWEGGAILWPVLNFALWHKYWIEGEELGPLVAGSALAA